jgi:transcriptional regulator with XRE-family HTH domain
LNETLCRALLQARLTEEDVATRLQVDPKTVRRWLEGRVPYLRHRWAIAGMLGADETDLWPQLRATRTRPDEVIAIYPHRDTVPLDVWMRVFGSARREIGILDEIDLPLATGKPIVAALAERAGSGVKVRICLRDEAAPVNAPGVIRQSDGDTSTANLRESLAMHTPLRERGELDIRLYQGVAYNSIYYADDQLLVSQHAYGIPLGSAPVLHLRRADSSDMAAAYFDAFERAWAAAQPVG